VEHPNAVTDIPPLENKQLLKITDKKSEIPIKYHEKGQGH